MSKFITPKNLLRIKEYVPDICEIGSNKIFQLALLQLSNAENLNWHYHPDISTINNEKVHATRLVVEGLFQNHLVDWEGIRTRTFDKEEYNRYDCIDLYQAFYRRSIDDETESKEQERKNMFVYCPNFSIQLFRYKNFLYRKHMNKIICLPHQKLPELSPEIESIVMNIKILPMRECTRETMLKYIKDNYPGNILINGALSSSEYLLKKENKLKPKGIMIFMDKEYKHRDGSKKKQFPSVQTLLDEYDMVEQNKMDARMMFILLSQKRFVGKAKTGQGSSTQSE